MMNFCDLHTHVLPGADDGAATMEQALQMLKNAVASDVTVLAVTPHCNVPGHPDNYMSSALKDRFSQLQQAAAQMPIRLVLGAEVAVTDRLPELLRQKKLPTINNSRYLLTEFPLDYPAESFPAALQQILEGGCVPLVAHPERYAAICKNPRLVAQWLDMGCHLQLTGGSILGQWGRSVQRAAAWLLQNDFVACVASDAHGVHHRSNFLLDVHDHLSVYYSRAYAKYLMYINPMRICQDDPL